MHMGMFTSDIELEYLYFKFHNSQSKHFLKNPIVGF